MSICFLAKVPRCHGSTLLQPLMLMLTASTSSKCHAFSIIAHPIRLQDALEIANPEMVKKTNNII
ncbi:MAG TPA: hypothetical protein PK002_00605 [Cellvibrio sp.]|nr:hypothetical protein [Cellvibrio sp.]